MVQLEETLSANLFNYGFSTTLTPDGVAFFSASHPLVGTGGIQANIPAIAADLTQTSFEQATTDIMSFVDDQGLNIMVTPKSLLVPPALYHTAHKLLETKQVVGSADNDKNILATMGIEAISDPYLTDTDAWFLITSVDNGPTFYTRREAKLDRDNDFETDNLKMKTTKRFAIGVTDFRGAYGSAGA